MTLSMIKDPETRRRRLSPEARRQQLLQIGLKVFANLGLEGAGHANIAQAANVSTATVFNYFPTRALLTKALIGEIQSVMRAEFKAMRASVDKEQSSARSRIYHAAQKYDTLIQEQPDLFKAFLMWSVSFNPELRDDYVAFQEDMVTQLEAFIGDDPQYKGHGRVLFGAGNALALMRFDDFSTEALIGYVKALTRGVTK